MVQHVDKNEEMADFIGGYIWDNLFRKMHELVEDQKKVLELNSKLRSIAMQLDDKSCKTLGLEKYRGLGSDPLPDDKLFTLVKVDKSN